MPRLTGEQLRAAKTAKRESLGRALVQACLGTERDIKAAINEIDQVFFSAIEYALWLWFNEILPQHFGPGASVRYDYPTRNQGYLIGKYTGQRLKSGKQSRFRLPKGAAYRIAQSGKDPNPLEFTGELRTQVTGAPASRPRVTRMTGGYRGRIILTLPPFVRQQDIASLKKYIPADIERMLGAVQMVVRGALA
jgi:hypothetical protein